MTMVVRPRNRSMTISQRYGAALHLNINILTHVTQRFPPFFTINVLLQPVTVRKFDLRINLNDICQASNQPKDKILRIRKEHSGGYDIVVDAEHHSSTYVDLWIAVDLCRRYGLAELEGKLRNLKGVPQEPVKESDLSEFIEITDFPSSVIVRRSDFRINASHIAKLAGRSRYALAEFRKTLSANDFEITRGNCKRHGTYVDFDVGLRLCREYELPDLEKRLSSLKRTSEGPVSEAGPSHVRPRSPELNTMSARNESTQSRGIWELDQPPKLPGGLISNGSIEAEDADEIDSSSDEAEDTDEIDSSSDEAEDTDEIDSSSDEAEDSDEIDSGSDVAGSGDSVTSREPCPIQRNPQAAPSIRCAKDATSLRQSGRDIKRSLLELADPHSPSAKSLRCENWDSRPQLSGLMEVRSELRPSSWKTDSRYGSFSDLFAPDQC